jgi:hypothetical protein
MSATSREVDGVNKKARINIEIDTQDRSPQAQSEGSQGSGALFPLARKKLGVLSSIGLSTDLLDALDFGFGYSNRKHREKTGYGQGPIRQKRTELVSTENCDVIASVGGQIVLDTIKADTSVPLVALVGNIPADPGNCLGGVSLESWKSNKDRIQFLLTKLGLPAGDVYKIGLYRNPNSKMATDEADDWRAQNPDYGGVSRIIDSTGNYDLDLNGGVAPSIVPANIRALVISADPIFQDNKAALVAAADKWASGQTGGANRHVVYPLQTYAEAITTDVDVTGRVTLLGPDLYEAYRLLGYLAREAAEIGRKMGFVRAANLKVEF